jgi:hypothetical protein
MGARTRVYFVVQFNVMNDDSTAAAVITTENAGSIVKTALDSLARTLRLADIDCGVQTVSANPVTTEDSSFGLFQLNHDG